MLGYEFRETYVEFLKDCEDNAAFFDGIKILSDWFVGVEEKLVGVAAGNDPAAFANAARGHLANSAVAMPIKTSVFIRAAGKIETALRELFPDADRPQDRAWKLADEIQGLVDKWDAYTAEKTPSTALPLVLCARALDVRLSEFKETLGLASNAITIDAPDMGDDEQELSILFASTHTVRACWEKLRAVEQIYSELCQVINISEASYPLRIGKIETGSLWMRVFGNTKAIEMMGELIRGAILFIHRNYTDEGRLGTISGKLQSGEEILKFAKLLEAAGVDTKEGKENMQKAFVKITGEFNVLLGDESKVTLNDEVFDGRIADRVAERLTYRRQGQIGNNATDR